jgi:hypothetical protein
MEQKNYRPITCSSTMYETLTGIIARRISVHLEEHKVFGRAKRMSFWKQRMQESTAYIKSNIGGPQKEKK